MMNTEIVMQAITSIPENKLIFERQLYEEQFFKRISETAYDRILKSMYKSGMLCKIGSGACYRPLKGKYGIVPLSSREIISAFTEDEFGTVVGYTMYNNLKLTTQVSKTVDIFSSRMKEETRRVGNVSIHFCDLRYTEDIKNVFSMLEVLQNFEEIQDLNYRRFSQFCEEFSAYYRDQALQQILVVKQYGIKTISLLKYILDYYKIPNHID